MKNILFVCTGNSARSIIAETIMDNKYKKKFKAFSAGSKPSGKINEHVKKFLENRNFDLSGYYSKNFNDFLKNDIKFYQVFTVCSNANNEVCPVWPEKDKIIYWDLDDPVVKIQKAKSDDEINSIIANTYNIIEKKIEDWIKDA